MARGLATAGFLLLSMYNSTAQGTPGAASRIAEEKFILINGVEQWVTLKGNPAKPVILFLHGGPGSPMSPYADSLLHAWEDDFVIAQWDQRGTGRTFGRHAPPEVTP